MAIIHLLITILLTPIILLELTRETKLLAAGQVAIITGHLSIQGSNTILRFKNMLSLLWPGMKQPTTPTRV